MLCHAHIFLQKQLWEMATENGPLLQEAPHGTEGGVGTLPPAPLPRADAPSAEVAPNLLQTGGLAHVLGGDGAPPPADAILPPPPLAAPDGAQGLPRPLVEAVPDLVEPRAMTARQEELLAALISHLCPLPLDDPEDSADDFVIGSKSIMALDVETLAKSKQAFVDSLPLFEGFFGACNDELLVLEDQAASKWVGEVHDIADDLSNWKEAFAEIKVSLVAGPLPPPPAPPAPAHLVQDTKATDLINVLKATYPQVMRLLEDRGDLGELPGKSPLFSFPTNIRTSKRPVLLSGGIERFHAWHGS